MHVPAQFQKIVISVNENGLVSALEEVSAPFPLDIDIGCIGAVQVMHDFTKVFIGSFYKDIWILELQRSLSTVKAGSSAAF